MSASAAERPSPYSPKKKPNADSEDLMGFLDSFRNDMCDRLTAFQRQLQETQRVQETQRQDTVKALSDMTAKTTAAHELALGAMNEIQALRQDMARGSDATSTASTDVPMGMTPRTRKKATPARAAPASPASTPTPAAAAAGHDAGRALRPTERDDGFTVVIGGFAYDSDKSIIQDFVTQKLAGRHDICDIIVPYPKGSVCLLKFRTVDAKWAFIKGNPKLDHPTARLWFSLPKTPAERERGAALSQTRKALLTFDENLNIRVLWNEGYVKANNVIVGRLDPYDHRVVQMSQSQMTKANLNFTLKDFMMKLTEIRGGTDLAAADIHDWNNEA